MHIELLHPSMTGPRNRAIYSEHEEEVSTYTGPFHWAIVENNKKFFRRSLKRAMIKIFLGFYRWS